VAEPEVEPDDDPKPELLPEEDDAELETPGRLDPVPDDPPSAAQAVK
jgi:hypothetical protein